MSPAARSESEIAGLAQRDTFSELRIPINCCLTENMAEIFWRLTANYFRHAFYKPTRK
jgi:hypothetical protein